MALLATVTEDIYIDIVISLHLQADNTTVIALQPYHPDIYFNIISHSYMMVECDLERLAKADYTEQQTCRKTVNDS